MKPRFTLKKTHHGFHFLPKDVKLQQKWIQRGDRSAAVIIQAAAAHKYH